MILLPRIHLLSALLTVALARGLAVFLAAYAVTVLAGGLSSDIRHLIWLGVIGSFVVIPLAWLALPAIRVGSWAPAETAVAPGVVIAPVVSRQDYLQLSQRVQQQTQWAPVPLPRVLSMGVLAFPAVWAVGAVVLFARLLCGRLALRRLASGAREDTLLQSMAADLAGLSRTRRAPALLLSDRCGVPFTFGARRPIVALPLAAHDWPTLRLRSALIHELSHIRRRDVLTQSIAYCVCIVFWFIPPLWLAYAAMIREADACCDQQVINEGIRGPEYAREILELAQTCRGRILLPCVPEAVGGVAMLEKRMKRVLGLKPRTATLGPGGAAKVLLVFLCCLVPLLALTCATKPALKTDDPLFGTWVNDDYDKARAEVMAKTVFFRDGREILYRHIADPEPFYDGTFVVEETWVDDEGYHWYRIHWAGKCCQTGRPWSNNTLARVNPAGTIWEANTTGYVYPDQFGPQAAGYGIMYKQE